MQIPLHNIIPCCHGNDKTEELYKTCDLERAEQNLLLRRGRWRWIPLAHESRTNSPGIEDRQERKDKKQKSKIGKLGAW